MTDFSKKTLSLIGCVFFLLIGFLISPVAAFHCQTFSFLHWSDLHVGHEATNYPRWHTALVESLQLPVQMLLFTGDATDNKNADESQFLARTQQFLDNDVQAMLDTGKPVLFCYGNNDFYLNYNTEPNNMQPVMACYKKTFGSRYYLDSLGNGLYPHLLMGMAWITINSQVFAYNSTADSALTTQQSRQTLQWLDSTLQSLPTGQTAIILSHIPPTWDFFNKESSWKRPYIKQLAKVLAKAKGPVIILAGHYHRNEVHAFRFSENRAVPIVDVGGISEKYNYFANYRIQKWLLNEKATPRRLEWQINYLDHPEWQSAAVIDEPFLNSAWQQRYDHLRLCEKFFNAYMANFWSRRYNGQNGLRQNQDGLRQKLKHFKKLLKLL